MAEGSQATAGRLDRIARDPSKLVHIVGLCGTGMSALAQYRALQGGRVSGSDRAFDRGEGAEDRRVAERLGIAVVPQDGVASARADVVVVSTAVEDSVKDVQAARAASVPVAHRAELLAAIVRSRPSIAVTGSSGKSTVTAMVFEALRGAGRDPGVLAGGDLLCLKSGDLRGNAWVGRDWLVIEADESDKSLLLYEPEISVILNVHRDHYEPAEVVRVFAEFARRTRGTVVLGQDPALAPLRGSRSVTVGTGAGCDVAIEEAAATATGSRFRLAGVDVSIPLPGAHNVANAAAALAACRAAGADLAQAAAALARFRGVARRFEVVARVRGVEVVDDYAHNPAKIAAALAAACERSRRVIAFFQPHGFAPMRFMREDLAAAFARGQRQQDLLFLSEIYFAGGTASRDLSSRDLCADVRALGGHAEFVQDRSDFVAATAAGARDGDCVLVMGARDPTLGAFARQVAMAVAGPSASPNPPSTTHLEPGSTPTSRDASGATSALPDR